MRLRVWSCARGVVLGVPGSDHSCAMEAAAAGLRRSWQVAEVQRGGSTVAWLQAWCLKQRRGPGGGGEGLVSRGWVRLAASRLEFVELQRELCDGLGHG